MEGRGVERDPEERGLAQVVLDHPESLGRNFGGSELPVGFEQPREENGDGFDRAAVLLGELRQLRPRQIRVRGDVVEVEADGGGSYVVLQ